MNLNLDEISANSTVALDLVPWLKPLEIPQQAARKQAPWHLWLEKFAFPWAKRCDAAADHWQEQAKAAHDKEKKRALRAKADSIPAGKTAALTVAAALANNGSPAQHHRRVLAWLDALKRQHGDRFGEVTLVLESRLLLHLGRANVLENVGLYCDRTTGLPLIPGTALKGILSTWACWAEHFNASDKSFREFTQDSTRRRNFANAEAALARRILGDDSPTGSEHAGDIIFVGGFPTTPPTLGLDIVNPHHRSDGSVESRLTPNAFLCLEPGALWRFAFFVRPGAPEAAALLDRTTTWLVDALTQTGIGAKTAAGYGRFRQPNAQDVAAQEKQAAEARAAEAAAAEAARLAAEKAKQHAAAQAAMASDYPQEATFKNRVLAKLNPGQLEQLRSEVAPLQQPANAPWLAKLKQTLASKDYKDIRRRLRDKDWFPKDWLPPQ
jgi:CRISPR type III-B/RAMP module RAMP protein Cmr6